jgi:hypothetical protein
VLDSAKVKPVGVFEVPYDDEVVPVHAGTVIGPVGPTTAATAIGAADAGVATVGVAIEKLMMASAATNPAMSCENRCRCLASSCFIAPPGQYDRS